MSIRNVSVPCCANWKPAMPNEAKPTKSRKLNPADYPYGIFSPSGQIPKMLWALNNHDALEREADSRGMEVFAWCQVRTETLLAEFESRWKH